MTHAAEQLDTTTVDSATGEGTFVRADAVTIPESTSTQARPQQSFIGRIVRVGRTAVGPVQLTYRAGDLRVGQVRNEIRKLLGD